MPLDQLLEGLGVAGAELVDEALILARHRLGQRFR
jgi:hypothetical protein